MNNLRATDEYIEALRGNDIGDAMDRLVERALGDASDEARAASLRPQPPAESSRSGIAIARSAKC